MCAKILTAFVARAKKFLMPKAQISQKRKSMSLIETPKKKQGYVYAFSNPSMPGKVKMGFSDDPRARRKQLYTTGVPDPFDVCCVVKVSDMRKAENLVHLIHYKSRTNEQREFFDLRTDAAIETLKLLGDDVTEKFKSDKLTSRSKRKGRSAGKYKGNKDSMFDAGLKQGDVLIAKFGRRLTSYSAVVDGDTEIIFEGERLSLNQAGLKIQHRIAAQKGTIKWPSINAWDHWTFNGQVISTMRVANVTKRPH